MKYIKTFENKYEFLKYVILKHCGDIFIVKILSSSWYIIFKKLYKYENDELIENDYFDEVKYNYDFEFIINNTLFQSDNLQECIDIIPDILATKKYNL